MQCSDTYENSQNSVWKITTLYCFDFFSHLERACLFARRHFIYLWMKRCFLSSIRAVLKRDMKMFIPRIYWLYGNCVVNTTLWICWDYLLTCQGKSFRGKFFSLCCSYQAKISQVIRSFIICEKFPSLLYLLVLYLSLSIYWSILRSCDRFWVHRQRVAVLDVIVARKREQSQVKNQIFVCGRLGNFPQKIFTWRKFPDRLTLYQ